MLFLAHVCPLEQRARNAHDQNEQTLNMSADQPTLRHKNQGKPDSRPIGNELRGILRLWYGTV